jgi:RimJ/RimL family protein N-acetyltransferase
MTDHCGNNVAMTKHKIGPETERLLHRAFAVDDAEAFFALNGNRDVMRLTGEPPIESVECARTAIAAYPDFDTVGYGRWACVLKENMQIIGFCGLKHIPELNAVDVGYRFLPKFWGQGFATEACTASLRFGFDTLHLGKIIGLVLPENAASIHVLEKAGMRKECEVEYDGLLALQYSVERTQFA